MLSCARSSSLEFRPTLACLSKLPLCHRFCVGYSVFLDQYVLSATAPLALTLGEELDASASAILAWSNSYQDSEYYKKEFNYLEGRENQSRGRYVIAKLDETTLRGFAQGKIFVDFSERREGAPQLSPLQC